MLIGVTVAPRVGAQQTSRAAEAVPADVELRIETSRAAYHVGDTVKVRLAYSNRASAPIRFHRYPPWGSARLVLSDEAGHVVVPPHEPAGFYLIGSHSEDLPGGETRVRQWDKREWFDLQLWGYRLLPPGRYTLRGAPMLVTGRERPESALRPPDLSLRSNEVTFTVVR
jgi:hypothetical protein